MRALPQVKTEEQVEAKEGHLHGKRAGGLPPG